jgi:hypothetical protein
VTAYRAQAAFACLAFAVAAGAGLAYGAHNGSFFAGVPALALVALAWGGLWATAGHETPGPRLDRRIRAARLSGTVGLAIAAALVVAVAL